MFAHENKIDLEKEVGVVVHPDEGEPGQVGVQHGPHPARKGVRAGFPEHVADVRAVNETSGQ
jgi:hypothetical protein